VFEKILNSSVDMISEDSMQPFGRGDCSSIKKRVKRVMEVGCRLPPVRPLSRSERRPENSESILY